jgi:flagellar basal body rod protein FlgG
MVDSLFLQPSSRLRSITNATSVMNRIGKELVEGKKQAILDAAAAEGKSDLGKTQIERSNITTRDILSRLIAANMATDLMESQRLSDEDVLARELLSLWLALIQSYRTSSP